ncbi:MAG: hypothetical protein K9H64_03455 [Bacteroidales bacterium]|nr:hypothetical protein [Bacteroidales bacterium]MCF8456438.1 hypothetical protein [Bacteroidales bacterium]
MKKIIYNLLVLFLLLLNSSIIAQNIEEVFTLNDKLFTFITKQHDNGDLSITITNYNDDAQTVSFIINKLKMKNFELIFSEKLKSLFDSETKFDKEDLSSQARELFTLLALEVLLEKEENVPIIGELTIDTLVELKYYYPDETRLAKLKKCLSCKSDKKKNKNIEIDSTIVPNNEKNAVLYNRLVTIDTLIVKDVEIEFFDGFIETIKINASGDNTPLFNGLVFENKYGIGFSSRINYKALYETKLYSNRIDTNIYVVLGDVLKYDYKIRQRTKDYSPQNNTIYTYGGEKVELRKMDSNRLFDFIVFTDLMGVNGDNPNGLVQTEFSKDIQINTRRHQTTNKFWLNKLFQGYGWLQFIEPSFTLSKLEDNNRYLIPLREEDLYINPVSGPKLRTSLRTNPLDIHRYQRLSLGIDLNVLFFDSPEGKFHAQINAGARFGSTLIRDSIHHLSIDTNIVNSGIVNDFGINYFTLSPEAKIQFYPDERFGMVLSYRLNFLISAFNNPELISEWKNGKPYRDYENKSNTFEIMGFWQTKDSSNKIFVRWRFHNQVHNIYNNYHQFQTGILFYINNNK